LKIQNSLDSIFQLYNSSVTFYENWTGIHYPFQKNGMVAVPDFQFGGMEHPGAILLQNNTLFLDKNATQNQLNNRSNLIAHEVAHQWFGDLVTMNWFTDVWMKEVFANYMADKSTGALADKLSYDLKFLTTHFLAAYSVDRTLGSNPIRQKLGNLQDAGMLYGSIIYDKAPIMMRQLELLIGSENFQKGVCDYLKKYEYGNASWPDLIICLKKYSNENLTDWNQVWVNETGRPIINYKIQYKNNTIKNFLIKQHPEYGSKKNIWKQTLDIALYYKDSIVKKQIDLKEAQQETTEFQGHKKPLFVLINASGLCYGVFQIDSSILEHFNLVKDPVQRASCYISLYENMLNHTAITPQKLLHFFSSQLIKETSELNLRLICNYINTIYWEFTTPKERKNISTQLEEKTWFAVNQPLTNNNKKILFECYENIFQSRSAY
ncbi:MAG: aminopeptidase, partial [Pseudopedobacter saltans]